jgi:NADH dehydrogenase FAD-containing subunit
VSDTKKIVVLGGGYGGVHAVKTLYKAFKKDKSVEITLIDRNPYHTLMTELHEIAGAPNRARSGAGQFQADLRRQADQRDQR